MGRAGTDRCAHPGFAKFLREIAARLADEAFRDNPDALLRVRGDHNDERWGLLEPAMELPQSDNYSLAMPVGQVLFSL
jgi:hypothetical protein